MKYKILDPQVGTAFFVATVLLALPYGGLCAGSGGLLLAKK